MTAGNGTTERWASSKARHAPFRGRTECGASTDEQANGSAGRDHGNRPLPRGLQLVSRHTAHLRYATPVHLLGPRTRLPERGCPGRYGHGHTVDGLRLPHRGVGDRVEFRRTAARRDGTVGNGTRADADADADARSDLDRATRDCHTQGHREPRRPGARWHDTEQPPEELTPRRHPTEECRAGIAGGTVPGSGATSGASASMRGWAGIDAEVGFRQETLRAVSSMTKEVCFCESSVPVNFRVIAWPL
ncbi:hypothetical protein GCM10009665_09090 [Kitasatospora nipponensis]|uniref:Uncharacterized protein n=1 Tax=Kitasatospora nipponensis TaxID=258049 RepID=A0ABN1VS12_9ACTN